MATLVDVCLRNEMDLPHYRFHSEEVELFLCSGKLLDERMERLFQSFDGYIEGKLMGNPLSELQKLVLAYLIKSEWANEQLRYTILLTPDNNHFSELIGLEKAGLIAKPPQGQTLLRLEPAGWAERPEREVCNGPRNPARCGATGGGQSGDCGGNQGK